MGCSLEWRCDPDCSGSYGKKKRVLERVKERELEREREREGRGERERDGEREREG